MSRYLVVAIALGLVVFPRLAIAAGTSPQSPFKPPSNLRVLSKDTKLTDILPVMKGFTQALGVRCQFCHSYTGSDPNTLENFDFPGDAVPAKATARTMMTTLQVINGDLLRGVGAPAPAGQSKVTCYTCHRGERTPQTVPGPAR
jgi:photosynthetic reaction center cytochrome c subunit